MESVKIAGSTRVLHVDDDKDQRFYVKKFIEMMDDTITITPAASPLEALKTLENETFDCIVTDYRMPEMNGIEFTKKILTTIPTPPQIIIYTAHGSEEIASEAFEAGVDD